MCIGEPLLRDIEHNVDEKIRWNQNLDVLLEHGLTADYDILSKYVGMPKSETSRSPSQSVSQTDKMSHENCYEMITTVQNGIKDADDSSSVNPIHQHNFDTEGKHDCIPGASTTDVSTILSNSQLSDIEDTNNERNADFAGNGVHPSRPQDWLLARMAENRHRNLLAQHSSNLQQPLLKLRKKLNKIASAILTEWLNANWDYPYPTQEDKQALAAKCGISEKQVNNWFINNRTRKWRAEMKEMVCRSRALAATVEHNHESGDRTLNFDSDFRSYASVANPNLECVKTGACLQCLFENSTGGAPDDGELEPSGALDRRANSSSAGALETCTELTSGHTTDADDALEVGAVAPITSSNRPSWTAASSGTNVTYNRPPLTPVPRVTGRPSPTSDPSQTKQGRVFNPELGITIGNLKRFDADSADSSETQWQFMDQESPRQTSAHLSVNTLTNNDRLSLDQQLHTRALDQVEDSGGERSCMSLHEYLKRQLGEQRRCEEEGEDGAHDRERGQEADNEPSPASRKARFNSSMKHYAV